MSRDKFNGLSSFGCMSRPTCFEYSTSMFIISSSHRPLFHHFMSITSGSNLYIFHVSLTHTHIHCQDSTAPVTIDLWKETVVLFQSSFFARYTDQAHTNHTWVSYAFTRVKSDPVERSILPSFCSRSQFPRLFFICSIFYKKVWI